MGVIEDMLCLRDKIGSDQGLEDLRKIVEKEDPQKVRYQFSPDSFNLFVKLSSC